jgi:hypothetical protein
MWFTGRLLLSKLYNVIGPCFSWDGVGFVSVYRGVFCADGGLQLLYEDGHGGVHQAIGVGDDRGHGKRLQNLHLLLVVGVDVVKVIPFRQFGGIAVVSAANCGAIALTRERSALRVYQHIAVGIPKGSVLLMES